MQRLSNRYGKLLGMLSTLVLLAVFTANTHASGRKLSDLLESNGFTTLKTALDVVELSDFLDRKRVAILAPTNDVFDELAEALGCPNAVEMALALDANNLLEPILTYHAALGNYDPSALLRARELEMANGGTVTTGVDMDGLYVQGDFNTSAARITAESISKRRYTVYPIDQILLPVDPAGLPAPLCIPE